MRDSLQRHNSCNQQQAKLASVAMLQPLWFGFRVMWTEQSSTEPFILMCIPLKCVTLASAICISCNGGGGQGVGRGEPAGESSPSPFHPMPLPAGRAGDGRNRESILF